MIRIICFLLIAAGGVIMVLSTFRYHKFLKITYKSSETRVYPQKIIYILRAMLLFFILSFAVGAYDILLNDIRPVYYFISVVFFVASAFFFMLTRHLTLMAHTVLSKNRQLNTAVRQIENKNKELHSEVEQRVKKILQQDKILHTVNEMASLLLASDTKEFDSVVLKCMGMLAESVKVDRTYVWENFLKGGELYCTQVYEWSGGADPQQGNELTVEVAFPEDWYERLSNNRFVNGIVSTFPKREKEHLQAQGIISILVVPVFLKDKFWGFIGFDDCHQERMFSEAEENILRSASLLIATSMLRNEITKNLVAAREEALSSTKAKSEFLSNMSHEIRTPINAITGMTAIARITPEKTKDCLDKIDAASYQLLGIINDILDMSKIEAGKMELAKAPFNLPAIIQNVKSIIEIRANEKHQSLSVKISPDIPEVVIGDDVRVSQILINLLSNAVKFTAEKGKIGLDVRLAGKNEDNYILEAKVNDNGIGITPEQQQRLFNAFEQADRNTSRNYGGSGLGLAISKSIAQLMHGGITVNSKPGEGSCFTVTFQLKGGNEGMMQKGKGINPADKDFSNKTALLVEDIEINREIVMAILKPTNLSIDYAENGKDAVKMFLDNPDKYDIIFMDIQMPGMDGYQTTQSIRALNISKAKTVPIIAMTANAYKEDVEKALQSGMNGHLSKPINIEAVIEVLTKYLG